MIKRRTFIAGLGSTAAWPVVARAQQSNRMRRIGVLVALAADDPEGRAQTAAFLMSGFTSTLRDCAMAWIMPN